MSEISFNIDSSSNPSSCSVQDGSITISGLEDFVEYTISYDDGILQSFILTSDVNGELVLSGLSSGMYADIIVTATISGCSDNLGDIELITSSFSANSSWTNPSGCTTNDGAIVVSGLIASASYTINYNVNGSTETLTAISDPSGNITFSNLAAGSYEQIVVTEDATGCTAALDAEELTSPQLTASISFTNPSACGIADGQLIITNLLPNTDYELTYDNGIGQSLSITSNGDGAFVLLGLNSGSYNSIILTENSSGCTNELGDVLLSRGFESNMMAINPSNCNRDDGSIVISNLLPSVEYTVTYGNGINQSITQITNDNGIFVVAGLGPRIYADIFILDNLNQCTANLGAIELDCFDTFDCFKTKKFFTPNGDNYNDYWYLEELSGNCDYTVFIFDRYGKIVATLTPNENRWDGAYNGVNMPSSDYWYLIRYKNHEGLELEYSSHFSLKR